MTTEAHLWLVNLPDVDPEIAVLDATEKTRAERFIRSVDQVRYIHSHVALRRILAGHLGRSAREIAFIRNEHGKLALDSDDIAFSLSHSGEKALIGLAQTPIGVDIERVRTDLNYREIATDRLDPEDCLALETAPSFDAAITLFFRAWTRHEAAGKATGRGLSADIAERAAFTAVNIDAPTGYAAAVATPFDSRLALTLHFYPNSSINGRPGT